MIRDALAEHVAEQARVPELEKGFQDLLIQIKVLRDRLLAAEKDIAVLREQLK